MNELKLIKLGWALGYLWCARRMHYVGMQKVAAPLSSSVIIDDLVARGKTQGFLTSHDIGAALVAAELPPESTDAVLQLLTEEGLEILDVLDDGEDDKDA